MPSLMKLNMTCCSSGWEADGRAVGLAGMPCTIDGGGHGGGYGVSDFRAVC